MLLVVGTTPALQRAMVFPRLVPDGVNRATEVYAEASGKPLNIVRILRELGRPGRVITFVGGYTGQFILQRLAELDIHHDLVHVDPPTRTCITMIDRQAGTVTELVEEAAPLPDADYQAMRSRLRLHLPRARMLLITGSLPPGADEGFYADCAAMAAEAKVPTMLDLRGPSLLRALPHRPLLVKPNRSELAGTFGQPLDTADSLRDAMARLVDAGAQWAMVTLGREGFVLGNGRRSWHVTTPPVRVFSPIGSGDALAAGLATALLDGEHLPDACRLAAACAAANAMTPMSGEIHRRDVQSILPTVCINPM